MLSMCVCVSKTTKKSRKLSQLFLVSFYYSNCYIKCHYQNNTFIQFIFQFKQHQHIERAHFLYSLCMRNVANDATYLTTYFSYTRIPKYSKTLTRYSIENVWLFFFAQKSIKELKQFKATQQLSSLGSAYQTLTK